MSDVESLLGPWPGPYGGLPPLDKATPALIEQATMIAIERKRAEVAAIAANAEPPSFANTIEAYEDCGRDFQRMTALRGVFATTRALGDMPQVQQRLAQTAEQLEDEIAHNDQFFARIEAVRKAGGLAQDQQRLTDVIYDRMRRRGAGLSREKRDRLMQINAKLAGRVAAFVQNLSDEERAQAVFFTDEAALEGLPAPMIAAAAKAAETRGRHGEWAIPNMRPCVWPVLTSAQQRETRRQVWAQWMMRGEHDGSYDNRPVIAEILKLRGEKAKLLGFASFAHFACAARMAGTPEAAMAQLLSTWAPVLKKTQEQLADMQALADADGLGGPIQAWDRHYYAERLRQSRFGLDANAVRPYLELNAVLQAIFHAAGKLHGVSVRELFDVPVMHPDIRVFEVNRDGRAIGLVWFDLLQREGKVRGSWQYEYRAHESFRHETITLSSVCSNLERSGDNGPVLMGWEYANVLFHEFGHALHMIMSQAKYPSLGSIAVAWDMVEVPSQLNERWLYDRDLLRQFMRHHETGEPIPDAMIDAIEAAARFDRVFSVGLDYLCPAIVDLRAHLAADGGDVDALAIEAEVRAELGMPDAIDMVMRAPHMYHAFGTDHYAAGLYVYLWADVMVADIIAAFLDSPGGLYDAATAQKWRDTLLSVGNSLPGKDAFRAFRGRDPDPMALMRRFGLDQAA
jgi:peptidyl-dipeptidase Dcp